jgi:hypothetical protein
MANDQQTTKDPLDDLPPLNWNDALLHLLDQRGIPPCSDHAAAALHSLLVHVREGYEAAVQEDWTAENGLGHPAAAVAAARYYAAVEGLSATLADAFQRIAGLRSEWRSIASELAEDGAPCGCPLCADDLDEDDGPIRH